MRNVLSSAGEGSPRVPRNGMREFRSSWAHPIRHGLPASRAGTDPRLGEQMDRSAEDAAGPPTALAQDPAAADPVAVPQQRAVSPGTATSGTGTPGTGSPGASPTDTPPGPP